MTPMSNTTSTVNIEVCVDCAYVSANGTSGAEFSADFLDAYEQAVREYGGEPVLDADCSCGFSWESCDFCGSRLGGDRHSATLTVSTGE